MSSLSPAPSSSSSPSDLLTRREAIARTAALLGIALTPALLSGVLHAQTAPAARPATAMTTGAAGAHHLNAEQFATVSAAAERILPRTDTPGAIDVGVPAFIDLFVGEYMTSEEKRVFLAGLAEVETASAAAHQKKFGALAAAQQDALLQRIADASQAKEKTFFHQLRELTLLGYFTSEPVGKNVTHYDPVPGVWRACVPISEVGNVAWTR